MPLDKGGAAVDVSHHGQNVHLPSEAQSNAKPFTVLGSFHLYPGDRIEVLSFHGT
jgi:hypothetical protein